MIRTILKTILFSVIFLASGLLVHAQEFQLSGVVFEKGSPNRVALVDITNLRTKFGVGSNDLGIFQLKAQVGDTLYFVKHGYADREMIVLSNRDMIVYLDAGTTLNQVNIVGQTKRADMDQVKQDYIDKGSFFAGKPPLLSYFFAPLTAFYELFGRTPKNAKRFGKYYNNEVQQTQIDEFFNEPLIQKNTDLQGKDLEDFMLNYRPDYKKAQHWTEYDYTKYIKDSYKQYTDTLKKK